jgi:hypothetical protein
MEPGLIRPLTVRNLLTVLPTSSDIVEWVQESTRVSSAAPVAEDSTSAKTGAAGALVRRKPCWRPAVKQGVLADRLFDILQAQGTEGEVAEFLVTVEKRWRGLDERPASEAAPPV